MGIQFYNTTPEPTVYAFRAKGTNLYKIGVTVRLPERQSELQTGCPHELELVGTRPGDEQVEKRIHRELSTYRIRGEWFDVPDVHNILKHFPTQWEIERHCERAIIKQLTGGYAASIAICPVYYSDGATAYQVMSDDSDAFWIYYFDNCQQFHRSKIEAIAWFAAQYHEWRKTNQ